MFVYVFRQLSKVEAARNEDIAVRKGGRGRDPEDDVCKSQSIENCFIFRYSTKYM